MTSWPGEYPATWTQLYEPDNALHPYTRAIAPHRPQSLPQLLGNDEAQGMKFDRLNTRFFDVLKKLGLISKRTYAWVWLELE